MEKAVFYHAGCPVCVNAEREIIRLLDRSRFELEIVHLGDQPERISDAENAGLISVPALQLGDNLLHLNYGASLEEVKNG